MLSVLKVCCSGISPLDLRAVSCSSKPILTHTDTQSYTELPTCQAFQSKTLTLPLCLSLWLSAWDSYLNLSLLTHMVYVTLHRSAFIEPSCWLLGDDCQSFETPLTLRAAQSESDRDHMAHISSPSSYVVSPAPFYREAAPTDTNNQESAEACTHTHTHTPTCVCFQRNTIYPLFSPFFLSWNKTWRKKETILQKRKPQALHCLKRLPLEKCSASFRRKLWPPHINKWWWAVNYSSALHSPRPSSPGNR